MKREGVRPRFRLGYYPPGERGGHRESFPFRKSWPAIIILLVMDVAFMIPAVTTFREAVEMWSQPDDLFNLVAALFISFWLLGWSIAPVLMTLILVVMVFGQESVCARPGVLEVHLGLPRLGLVMQYDPSRMRNLRIEHPAPKSGKSWRGSHVAFDYGANSGEFGSGVSELALDGIRHSIETATGVKIRRGEATSGELEGGWDRDVTGPSPDTRAAVLHERMVVEDAVTPLSSSTLALIAANLIPLAGALFFGWDLGAVLVLYWAESAVIGFYNLLKIIVIARWGALFYGTFFLGHFGGFMAGHFLFLYTFFIEGAHADPAGSGSLGRVFQMFYNLWPALVALFLSHGYSFLHNFIGRGEYRRSSIKGQMSEPYSRIVFMHLVIIFGGMLALLLGETTPVLLLIIGVKILFDVRAHLKQREPQKKDAGTGD